MNRNDYGKYMIVKKIWIILLILMIPVSGAVGGFVGVGVLNVHQNEMQFQAAGAVNALDADFDLTEKGQTYRQMASIAGLEGIPKVVHEAMPSVVGITTTYLQQDWYYGTYESESVGTGVIVDARGYILTNSHVVNDGKARSVTVLLYDGTSKEGEILWNDPALDLAVVKIDGKDLTVANLGNSDEILVGETAIAIGNPLGLTFERTVTAGIVSGLERTIPVSEGYNIEGLIQTDASINPGNSGGPLLNIDGQVIGINTVKVQSGEGLGFAIPINIAKPIVDEFIMKGEFTKVYVGIKGVNTYQYIRNFGDTLGTQEGVYVYEVMAGSPAKTAGIIEGDVITRVDDVQIDTITKLTRVLYKYRPEDQIKVQVIRNGKPVELLLTLKTETQ